jgi:multidrug efflux pump subunit AcrA (membrane-fusion protein)
VRTNSFIVKIDVPAHKGLITGMYGKAFFTVGRREAILVPKSAVVEMSGISGVYVVSADRGAVFQMIQVGEEHGNFVEIVSGLKKGDRVISDKHLGRIDGKKVVVAEK